jgi:Icc-related predicted phosphoesterase
MRLVCISDTHGLLSKIKVPDGDILLFAGDVTRQGTLEQLKQFNNDLLSLSHKYKICIGGNHDFCLEKKAKESRQLITNAIYLQDQLVEVNELRIYGSPWQPWFYNWAFNLQRGQEIKAKWDLIPEGIDVLITHGPAFGHGDRTFYDNKNVGCTDLLDAIKIIKPKIHVFGHIHEGYGITSEGKTLCINASICDLDYNPTNKPIVIDL